MDNDEQRKWSRGFSHSGIDPYDEQRKWSRGFTQLGAHARAGSRATPRPNAETWIPA